MNVKRQILSIGRWVLRHGILLLLLALSAHPLAAAASDASPNQDDVLRAISQNVDEPTNGGPMLIAIFAVIGGLTIIFILLSRREKREAAPKSLVHHGKLVREIIKSGVPLKPIEFRQLKLLADHEPPGDDADPPLSSPLTLLLCPSVLAKRLKTPPPKLDRKVLAQVVRKIGVRKPVAVD